jgi:hypothetical protein|tara:strand:- start:272 stop:853 length:582 start_codon:yes stop_codon:yes gene_type:complete
MSEFFSNYPRIAYDITGSNSTVPDYDVAVNLMVRNKLKDAVETDVSAYYPYVVPEGMRPDVLAHQYYGDTIYTWTIYLVNNILDPYWEWPLSYKDFRTYMIDKYGSIEIAQSQIHHYEYTARARAEKTGTSVPVPEYKLEIDYQTYTETAVDEREIIYSYGYEQDLNELKREIQLIDVAYITQVQDEARGLFR